jgi:hypothetical protein
MAYADLIGPISESVLLWTAETDRAWPGAVPAIHAELLRLESARLAVLCTATSGVEPDYVLKPAHGAWVESLHARQRWASEAAHGLGCCGNGATAEIDALRTAAATQLKAAAAGLASAAGERGVAPVADHSYEIVNERLAIGLNVPPGWVVARNDTQIALMAPYALQVNAAPGLGVDGSNMGTGVRVRRLRKQAGWTLEGAADQAKAALAGLGQETSRRAVTAGGEPAIELLLEATGVEWTTRLVTVGAGDYAYFIELGCPRGHVDLCRPGFESVLAGLTFRPQ